MIHVLATVHLFPGKRSAFLAEFHKLVPLVRLEEGCVEYGPTVDISAEFSREVPRRSDTVVIVEQWTTLAALEAHLVAPHMAPYRAAVKELIERSELQVLQTA